MTSLAGPELADVQARLDVRGVALDEVGVAGLRYPVTVAQADGTAQHTVCSADLAVALAASERGTHMSRFVELLHERRDSISPTGLLGMAREIADRLEARHATVKLSFPFFVPRPAPVTGALAMLGLDCTLAAVAGAKISEVRVGIRVPVTSLCPCSKEIADYSAHSQRGYVAIDIEDACWPIGRAGLWPEDLLVVCDRAASAPIYPLLKRPDERYVTMLAYDHPAFVEDLARETALALQADERVASFRLDVANAESIHDHQAIARLSWRRQ